MASCIFRVVSSIARMLAWACSWAFRRLACSACAAAVAAATAAASRPGPPEAGGGNVGLGKEGGSVEDVKTFLEASTPKGFPKGKEPVPPTTPVTTFFRASWAFLTSSASAPEMA